MVQSIVDKVFKEECSKEYLKWKLFLWCIVSAYEALADIVQ